MRAARPATWTPSANATGANTTTVDPTLADDIEDFAGSNLGAIVVGASVMVGVLALCVLL